MFCLFNSPFKTVLWINSSLSLRISCCLISVKFLNSWSYELAFSISIYFSLMAELSFSCSSWNFPTSPKALSLCLAKLSSYSWILAFLPSSFFSFSSISIMSFSRLFSDDWVVLFPPRLLSSSHNSKRVQFWLLSVDRCNHLFLSDKWGTLGELLLLSFRSLIALDWPTDLAWNCWRLLSRIPILEFMLSIFCLALSSLSFES